MTAEKTSGQSVPKLLACPEGLFLMDGIKGLRSLPRHSVDMLLTDPPYGTTRNFWDVPLPLPELWEGHHPFDHTSGCSLRPQDLLRIQSRHKDHTIPIFLFDLFQIITGHHAVPPIESAG